MMMLLENFFFTFYWVRVDMCAFPAAHCGSQKTTVQRMSSGKLLIHRGLSVSVAAERSCG